MDNGEGIDCGREDWAGWRGAKKEKKWDNFNRINNEKKSKGKKEIILIPKILFSFTSL